MQYFPFVMIAATILLVMPSRFIKKKYQKYTEKMKEFVWIDNYTEITKSELKAMMVKIDQELGTTKVREDSFNFFADQFVDSLLNDLNNITISNAAKIKKLHQANDLLEMNFETPARLKIREAIDKLQGNIKI